MKITLNPYYPSPNIFKRLWQKWFYTIKRVLPESWNELSSAQLHSVCGLMFSGLSEDEFLLRASDKLLDAPKWVMNKINTLDMAYVCSKNEWLLRPQLTKSHWLKFKIRNVNFYGPSDRMESLSFGQYTTMTQFLKIYHQTQNRQYLLEAVACLFTLNNKEWFYESIVSAAMGEMNSIQIHALQIFIQGCLEYIQNTFPTVFEGSDDEESSVEEKILSMAGDKFGDYNQTFHTPLYRVLEELKRLAKQEKKLTDAHHNS